MKRILIIASHPDDETLGCGGLISKLKKQGADFFVLFIGEGSTCRFKDPSSKEALSSIENRNFCAKKTMEFLGIDDYYFNNFPCGRFDTVPILEINKVIENIISEFKPDTIFSHSPNDANSDHQITYKSTIISTRPGALNSVESVYTFEVLSSSEWSFLKTFKPNYFIELNQKDVDVKCEALGIYESELKDYPFPRSSEGIKTLAMLRGMQSGFYYAEAFSLIRKLQK